jgi:hypothetical protein
VPLLLVIYKSLNWIVAIVVALTAAIVFRQGYEEVAAVLWLGALILVLPMWADPTRAKRNRRSNPPND